MSKCNRKANKLVVADCQWAETLPSWILEAIREERLILGLADILKESETVGNAEILAYLYTLSLRQPLSHELAEVYFYVTAQCMSRSPTFKGKEIPEFLRVKLTEGLTESEEQELQQLKRELYSARGGTIEHPLLNVMRKLKNKSNS